MPDRPTQAGSRCFGAILLPALVEGAEVARGSHRRRRYEGPEVCRRCLRQPIRAEHRPVPCRVLAHHWTQLGLQQQVAILEVGQGGDSGAQDLLDLGERRACLGQRADPSAAVLGRRRRSGTGLMWSQVMARLCRLWAGMEALSAPVAVGSADDRCVGRPSQAPSSLDRTWDRFCCAPDVYSRVSCSTSSSAADGASGRPGCCCQRPNPTAAASPAPERSRAQLMWTRGQPQYRLPRDGLARLARRVRRPGVGPEPPTSVSPAAHPCLR